MVWSGGRSSAAATATAMNTNASAARILMMLRPAPAGRPLPRTRRLNQNQKQIVRIADDRDFRRGAAATGKFNRSAAGRYNRAARRLQQLDGGVDIAHLQLHAGRPGVLDVRANRSTVDAFEVDEFEFRTVRNVHR